MKIQSLRISNFRAISYVHLADLANTIVIAGPNGSGKSCIFDAIRLLKSIYGGYQPNEWHQWAGEFQIDINGRGQNWSSLLQVKDQPLRIEATVELSEQEANYLQMNAETLLTEQAWLEFVPELRGGRFAGTQSLAAQHRVHEPHVRQRVSAGLREFSSEAAKKFLIASILIDPQGQIHTTPSRVLELIFSRYDSQHIGIIDYHGANRTFARESIGGVNLNVEQSDQRMRQHALYNSAAKFNNLKTEIASGYIRQVLKREAGANDEDDLNLGDTLKELFTTFFPGKEFLGCIPTPDGRIRFPIRTATGAEHDIDELSSGEKEVLYGYLRLRNAAPRHSVLLIDEPELHLNPRLMTGLADFYHRHLSSELGSQLWLVTHSDTLIREATGSNGFSVFHLRASDGNLEHNQATPVNAQDEVQLAVIDLIGDLAAYRPGAKLVLFEGGGVDNFDVRVIKSLFPVFASNVNCEPCGSKHRLKQFFDLLETTRSNGLMVGTVYSVTDGDDDVGAIEAGNQRQFRWPVYHIENFLLDAKYILRVLEEVNAAPSSENPIESIEKMLVECAKEVVPQVVAHKLRREVNRQLMSVLEIGTDPRRSDVANAISDSIERARQGLQKTFEDGLARTALSSMEIRYRRDAEVHITTGEWKRTFPGRSVLSIFVGKARLRLPYQNFRDLILARMKQDQYQPEGMKEVLNRISCH